METFVRHDVINGETLRAFRRVRVLRWPALVLAIVALALLRAGASQAVQLTVCSSGCHYTTIAAALADAHDGDTIAVGPGTYAGEFTINHSIRLAGAGQAATRIVGPGVSYPNLGPAVVTVPAGVSVTIAHLKITRGFSAFFGAGIDNSGTLRLRHALLDDNFGENGGGIYNHAGASASVSDSEISDNIGGSVLAPAGFGGGIYNQGTITLTRTRLDGNGSGGDGGAGGGIFNDETGTATFSDSRIVHNRVNGFFGGAGGGILNLGTMTLWRTPIVENTAHSTDGPAGGGGISNSGRVTLIESWVTENVASGPSASGGGVSNGGVITLIRSGVIRNTPDNCVGC